MSSYSLHRLRLFYAVLSQSGCWHAY